MNRDRGLNFSRQMGKLCKRQFEFIKMSLVIITGGLRGFGHFIAEAFRQDSSSPVDLILTSSQYQESDSQQQKEGADISGKDTASVERRVHLDFSTPLEQQRTRIETICTEIEKMTKKRPGGYERVILVNNAGTLGPLEHIDSMATHLTQLQAAVHLNITSLIFWTSSMVSFLTKQFGSGSLTVVNVSSLAALQPFDCWSVYCAGKAGMLICSELRNQNNLMNFL